MSLDKKDLEEILDDKLTPVTQGLAALRQDVTSVRQDVVSLRQDVARMASEVNYIKETLLGEKDHAEMKRRSGSSAGVPQTAKSR